ncbi:transketolase [Candidatus Dependentiae bacterium]|nr:MAG: transketolase [Candidatus Dependentiae bacterium]
MNQLKQFLEHKAYNLRVSSIRMTSNAGSGHPTSCLSAADLVAALFFYAMHFDPKHIDNPDNDRFILSKGHASPILYAVWKELGALTEKDLLTYRHLDSTLEGHPTLRFPYAEAATGSLGIGLSIGAGMSFAARLDKRDFYTYVLLGDSEITEGCIWEAIEIAAYYKLHNLVGVLDCNRLGQSTETIHGYNVDRYKAKFEAFGWKSIVIDGHNMNQIMEALDKARKDTDQPTMIIAKTFKSYGVEQAEDKLSFHGKAFKKEQLPNILKELKQRFSDAASYNGDYKWKPKLPKGKSEKSKTCIDIKLQDPSYKHNEEIPTRKVYGQTLAKLGDVCDRIISLDGEVKNSTFAEIFEAAHPDRFIQCFIAEQNMVGMAVGLNRRGFIPFVSTFGAFFTRAFDQIRMAAIGTANLRLVGSHAGVSIGQDGPSQMALEDISMMRSLPGSIVLYPCDAVSTYKLVHQMLEYTKGISYLRTTRMATPVIYSAHEKFPIGGCKLLRQSTKDKACIIGAGITVFEALKAYELLKNENISVSIIDLYSIKPLDTNTIISVAQKAGNKVITVEDHYLEGGLGQAVLYALRNSDIYIDCLAVNQLPRSGKPEELLALCDIDAHAIIKKVKQLI